MKKAAKQDKAAVEKTTENQEKAAESQDKTAVSGNISAERITVEEVKAETAEAAISTASESNADQAEAKPETLPESYRKRVRTALKGKSIPSAYYSSIYKAIINSYDKLALNNLLVKTFGSSRGGEVYKSIKDVFIDFQS